MSKIGVVLEGGAMRGLYTVGVLDVFCENNFYPDYIIGVSAGACNGMSYAAKQEGRGYRIIIDYARSHKYVGLRNLLSTKSVFGMDFIFDEIPNKLDPFDYDTFLNSSIEYIVGTTDVKTGEPVYFSKEELRDHDCSIIRASSAIPVLSPIVKIHDGEYLDGGTSDPIPVRKAIADGCDKVIVVLTQHHGFIKQPEKLHFAYKHMFKKEPAMIDVLDNRHKVYNETLRFIDELEKDGKALVIAPSIPILISRFEKKKTALNIVHRLGKKDGAAAMEKIKKFIQE